VLAPEDAGTFTATSGTHLPDTVQHSRRSESSAAPLWEPQTSQTTLFC